MTLTIETPKENRETKITQPVLTGLIPAVLGENFHHLPGSIKKLHLGESAYEVTGECEVFGASNFITAIAAKLGGMPAAGKNVSVVLAIYPSDGSETWARRFGDTVLTTVQKQRKSTQHSQKSDQNAQLIEYLGPGGVILDVKVTENGLFLQSSGLLLFGLIPILPFFAPKIRAEETEIADNKVAFDVEICAPLLGRMVAYKGFLNV